MILPIPGPGTKDTDWMHDYQKCHPCRDYLPGSGTPGSRRNPTGRRPGRPIGGKHSANRRAQWAASKRRAKARREAA